MHSQNTLRQSAACFCAWTCAAPGNAGGKFQINNDTGAIAVADTSLGAFGTTYTLTVNASDPGGLHDTASVSIRVGDANDNAPVIYEPQPFNLTLSEATPVGYEILSSAFANDTDFGSNAAVQFVLVAGNSNGEVSVNSSTGRIVTVNSLDYERSPTIQLVLAAQDGGQPPRQTTVTITINLLDVNDNPPVFQSPFYRESVLENLLSGSSVATVQAIDPDGPGNGSIVRYSFLPGFNAAGLFLIDSVSGIITLNGLLDRETVAQYELRVEASDQVTDPTQRMRSSVNVTIIVADINDNTPRFTMSPFVGGLLETAVRNADALRLNATDPDEGVNSQLQYSLTNSEGGAFRVDAVSGLVELNIATVSYATKRFYNMTAQVEDSGSPPR